MVELGNVNPVKRLSCPECRELLDDGVLGRFLDDDEVECPSCGRRIRLPGSALQKLRAAKYTGRNLDITA